MFQRHPTNLAWMYIGAIAIFGVTYVFSYWVFGYYTEGDQAYYRSFYEVLGRTPLEYVVDVQFRYTGSREPIYGLIMWISSQSVEKRVAISIFNSILMTSLLVLLIKRQASISFIILSFLNFYTLVMLTSAERLKFAYIFAILAALLPPLWRGAMIALSLLSHFSILIVLLALLLPQRYRSTLKSFREGGFETLKGVFSFTIMIVAFLSFLYVYQDPIISKVSHYVLYSYMDMGAALILFASAMLVTDNRENMLLTLSLPLVATFILGGDRVNMLTISIFLYVVLKERKTNHPVVLLLMLYLSYKSLDFMGDILRYGTGFVSD